MLKIKLIIVSIVIILITFQLCLAEVDSSLKEFVIKSIEHNESLFHNFETKFSIKFLDDDGIQKQPGPNQDEIISKHEYHYAREDNRIYSNCTTTWSNGYMEKSKQVFNGEKMLYYREDIKAGMVRAVKAFPTPSVPDRFTNLYRDVRDMTMSEFLEASTIKHIQSCEIKGHKGFMVHLIHCDSSEKAPLEQKIYFDAERGFVPFICETYRLDISSDKPVMVAEVLEFIEVTDDIHFPKKARLVSYFDRDEQGEPKFSSDVRCDISEVKINTNLPKDMFELQFPHGADVYDEIADLSYTVGGTDKILLAVENFAQTQSFSDIIPGTEDINSSAISIATKNGKEEIEQTSKEVLGFQETNPVYRHPLFWAITALVATLTLGLYLAINRKRLKRNESD